MKKTAYIAPECEIFAMLTEGICDLTVSGLNGGGAIDIGDGGDNDEDAPDPTAKSTNLWDGWE
jgi:hypothetical protein